jgi:hypothetical protein
VTTPQKPVVTNPRNAMTELATYICRLCSNPVEIDLTPELDETYRHRDATIAHAPLPVPAGDRAVCDLCGIPLAGVAQVFIAHPFQITVRSLTAQFTNPEWESCATCAQLVVDDDWDKILERQLSTLIAVACRPLVQEAIEAAAVVVTGFRMNWDGAASFERSTLHHPQEDLDA